MLTFNYFYYLKCKSVSFLPKKKLKIKNNNFFPPFFCASRFLFFSLPCWSDFVSAGRARPALTGLVTTLSTLLIFHALAHMALERHSTICESTSSPSFFFVFPNIASFHNFGPWPCVLLCIFLTHLRVLSYFHIDHLLSKFIGSLVIQVHYL